jgi:hypothetical protein
MIRFSTISNTNSFSTLSSRVQTQEQTSSVASTRVSLGNYELSNNVAAMKSQVAANNIKFNSNVTNSIQYLNAQAAVNTLKQVDGKIFISSDMFKSEKTNFDTKSNLQTILNNIDNTKKDKNGSNALMYFQQNKKDNEQKETKLNLLYA